MIVFLIGIVTYVRVVVDIDRKLIVSGKYGVTSAVFDPYSSSGTHLVLQTWLCNTEF